MHSKPPRAAATSPSRRTFVQGLFLGGVAASALLWLYLLGRLLIFQSRCERRQLNQLLVGHFRTTQ